MWYIAITLCFKGVKKSIQGNFKKKQSCINECIYAKQPDSFSNCFWCHDRIILKIYAPPPPPPKKKIKKKMFLFQLVT